MTCTIEYEGEVLQVTDDTAAELVSGGKARLVSGALPPWPPPADAAAPRTKALPKPAPKKGKK